MKCQAVSIILLILSIMIYAQTNNIIRMSDTLSSGLDPAMADIHSTIDTTEDGIPLLSSTFLGGVDDDWAQAVSVTEDGCIYIAGATRSLDFPSPLGEYGYPNGSYFPSQYDCYVMKFNTTGLVYTAFVGGSRSEGPYGIAVDSMGNVYVTGMTFSSDYPATKSFGHQDSSGDCFVFKLSPDGTTLLYSTIIAGNGRDLPYSIAIDESGCAYVTGMTYSSDFPTQNALDDTFNDPGPPYSYFDCFVFKLSPNGKRLIFSTYFGGLAEDIGYSITTDTSGCVYVGGFSGGGIPTMNALNDTPNGLSDCFILKLTPSGDEILYSSYIGGSSQDCIRALAVDSTGNVYMTGYTRSPDFPTVNAYDPEYPGWATDGNECFVLKLNSTGTGLVYSTFVGGTRDDTGLAIAVDEGGYAYVSGSTRSSNFPTLLAYDDVYNGGFDSFVLRLTPQGNALMYSTFVGGSADDEAYDIAIDSSGTAYTVGYAFSQDFPTVNAFDDTLSGEEDGFLFKLADISDSDNDSLSDYNESLYGTNRFSNDTDLDSLSDYDEIVSYRTSPLDNDSDHDSFGDGWEIANGFDPLDPLEPLQTIQTQQLTLLVVIVVVITFISVTVFLRWYRVHRTKMSEDTRRSDEETALRGLSGT